MPPRGRRPLGSPDARAAILAAARDLFAEQGFERTTVRGVARRAQVDPALVHHYFGTKDGLLAEVLVPPVDPAEVFANLPADRERLGVELVRRVLGVWEAAPENRARLLALLRTGLSHQHAAEILRQVLGRTFLAALRDVVEEDEAALRATLIGTQIGGLVLGRYALRMPAVAEASTEALVAAVGPAVQHYVTGSLGTPSP
ncbi:MAG TPA: TetR family transcriptional regulator [Actinomycetes bacterium]|nr:TetR family transcriptional regulator [Actinomycetes bacterium]